MKIGFTGTRKGMTPEQKESLRQLLVDVGMGRLITEWHDGSAQGADAEARELVRSLRPGALRLQIHSHPPLNDRWAVTLDAEVVHPPKPFLDRDHDIVDATDRLIACPKQIKEVIRSGTWATVRYARKQKKLITFIWPSGAVTSEHQENRDEHDPR